MRRGEILNLKWSHLDFKTRMIKAEKTKSGKMRHIPMNDVLHEELEKLRIQNDQSPYLFFNPNTGKPLSTVRRSFETACRKAGITELRFHDFRHTFASRLAQKGCDIETLRTLLGHYDCRLTQRYLHSQDKQKRQAVALLNKPKTMKAGDKLVTFFRDDESGEEERKFPSPLLSWN